ncbi:hypothetical protein CerSpe_133280 [Prunus speciosa]
MENGEIPENANEHCPGPQSDSAGKSDACEGCPNQQICATAPKGPDPDVVAIAERMATVKHKILVLSRKRWSWQEHILRPTCICTSSYGLSGGSS